LAALSRAGVPNFRTPEACADAIAAALARRAPQPIAARSAARAGSGGRLLDELAAGALLERLGIVRAPSVALDAGITRTPPLPFPYPVAVKLLSAEIAHKSDIGGVVLGVADGAALLAAIGTIRTNVAERIPEARVARVLVQPMVSGLGEVLLGYRVDRDVGPLVMVAAGGVLTEIERDRSLRLAPVDLAAAHEMIAEVRGLIALTGYRGKSKGDLAALADAIVALSRLADDASVAEAEINPLMVRPAGEGVVAVDAVARLMM
jgi:acyl-CoA synthetase (NDP forming)